MVSWEWFWGETFLLCTLTMNVPICVIVVVNVNINWCIIINISNKKTQLMLQLWPYLDFVDYMHAHIILKKRDPNVLKINFANTTKVEGGKQCYGKKGFLVPSAFQAWYMVILG